MRGRATKHLRLHITSSSESRASFFRVIIREGPWQLAYQSEPILLHHYPPITYESLIRAQRQLPEA